MNKLKTLWQKRQSYTLYWFVGLWAGIVDAGLFAWLLYSYKVGFLFLALGSILGCVLALLWLWADILAEDYK